MGIPISEEGERKHFDAVLSLALNIACGLLSNGGSVSRAENTVERICYAMGAAEVNVFAFPSIIEASVKISDGSEVSQMKRIYGSSNNFGKLEQFNQLSRDVCNKSCTLEEANDRLIKIDIPSRSYQIITVAGGGVAAGAFTVFYGGGLLDALPACLIGALMVYLNGLLSRRDFNGYARTFMLSLIGGFLCIFFSWIYSLCGVQCYCSKMIMGTIMVVIPGLLVCNAVRDMFVGDLFSGSFEVLNGVITTLAIVAGYGVALFILQPLGVDTTTEPVRVGVEKYVYQILSCMVGATAFSVMFNISFKHIAVSEMSILITFVLYLVMDYYLGEEQLFINILTATVFAAAVAEVFARLRKAPSTIFLVPPIIIFVPGGPLYMAFNYLIYGDIANAQIWGVNAGLTFLGIAVGISVVTALFQIVHPIKGRLSLRKKQPKTEKDTKFKKLFEFFKKK